VSESVELATILLTDLVGSTRLATSVGPVRADELREEHFGLLRQAIASTGGREVKNLGDGLMVAFGSASAAVSCAVAMQQFFERRYGQAEQRLHVRIGVGAGESTVKDGDYFGMPTVEAARLCAQAPADGILISTLVNTLAGRCEGIEFRSAGMLELKGLPELVEAFLVSWAPLGEDASVAGDWPLPPRCCARFPPSPTSGASMSALRSRRRWCSPATECARSCCSPASRGSVRRGFQATVPTAPTPRASPSAGALALKSWRCRMSHGSRPARSLSSTLRKRC
jgi:class 3 adenylate cyclase